MPTDAELRAFAEAARERLMRREAVEVPGLGRLAAQHEPSRVSETEDGRRLLHPPRDVVRFEPASS